MHNPFDVCLSHAGTELFVGLQSHGVRVLSVADGAVLRSFGYQDDQPPHDERRMLGATFGMCLSPAALDEIFICDNRQKQVLVFRATSGEFVRAIGDAALLHNPYFCCLHHDELIVSTATNKRLLVFDAATGAHTGDISSISGIGDGTLRFPSGLLVRAECGELIVTDETHHRVLVISL